MLRSSILISSLLAATQAIAADISMNGISFALPDGYERSADRRNPRHTMFVRKGDAKAELAKIQPKRKYDSRFLEDWFFNGTVAFLAISFIEPPPSRAGMSGDELQREFNRGGESQWGPYSFSMTEGGKGISWFVNYAGAFVAVASRVVDGRLVVVESMNMAHALIDEPPSSGDKSPAALWKTFRQAANADDAEELLLSAKPDRHDNATAR